MLTKEECRTALEILKEKANGETVDAVVCFKKLIDEHFEIIDKLKSGELSDGYHTFNELYHHRAVLFSVIVNANKEIAWKSKKHHDGTMYDGMFIVGVDTPQGQYSYHYNIEPYWNMFDCKELDNAPEWDGHEPKDIDRLLSIDDNPPLTIDDLKRDQEVYFKDYGETVLIRGVDKEENLVFLLAIDRKCELEYDFEPNSFYRKKVQK